jgi:hypothetical protein
MERRERREVDEEWGNRRRRHRCECLRAVPPGTIVASVTGFKPAIHLLDMLTTPHRGARPILGSDWAGAISPHRVGSDRSILSEVNHRLESRMREIRLSGLEGGLCQDDAKASCCTKDEGGPFGAVL